MADHEEVRRRAGQRVRALIGDVALRLPPSRACGSGLRLWIESGSGVRVPFCSQARSYGFALNTCRMPVRPEPAGCLRNNACDKRCPQTVSGVVGAARAAIHWQVVRRALVHSLAESLLPAAACHALGRDDDAALVALAGALRGYIGTRRQFHVDDAALVERHRLQHHRRTRPAHLRGDAFAIEAQVVFAALP